MSPFQAGDLNDGFPPVGADPTNADILRTMRFMHRENNGRLRELEDWRDGDRANPGAKTQIDRLTQDQQRLTWLGRAMVVAGLGGLVTGGSALVHSLTHARP